MRDSGVSVIYFCTLIRKGSGTNSILKKGPRGANREGKFNAFHSPRTF
jgi:hypothetical protein